MNTKKLYAAIAIFAIVAISVSYYEFREPLPFMDADPASMKAANIRAHAERGNADAQFALASLYAHGDASQGIPENAQKAEEWLQKAATSGHALSLYTLAEARQYNQPKEAETYYTRAIEKGFPPALFGYGKFKLREGTDLPKALAYIYAGANANDPNAQAFLATLLHDGLGLAKDPVGAILWLQKATLQAPTEERKAEWLKQQEAWTNSLNDQDSATLSEKLMTGAPAPGESSPNGLNPANGPIDPTLVLPR